MLPAVSATFHGRDVFAPAAAHLANGKPSNEFGPEIREIIRPAFTVASRKRDMLNGEVLYVDSFGNVVLNANKSDVSTVKIGEIVNLKVGNKSVRPRFSRAFGDVRKHELIFVVGSNEFLELSVNQGNAAEEFGIRSGDKFSLKL
jgi:S-adenosylmethionine hydrolase